MKRNKFTGGIHRQIQERRARDRIKSLPKALVLTPEQNVPEIRSRIPPGVKVVIALPEQVMDEIVKLTRSGFAAGKIKTDGN